MESLRRIIDTWKLRLAEAREQYRPSARRALPTIAVASLAAIAVSFAALEWNQRSYDRLVEDRLRDGVFDPSSRVWAGPTQLTTGSAAAPADVQDVLLRAGYHYDKSGVPGTFAQTDAGFEMVPAGVSSDEAQRPIPISFDDEQQLRIGEGDKRSAVELPRALLTTLPDLDRTKRRVLTREQIPTILRDALVAIEDHRFYDHGGVDWVRTAKGAYDGLLAGRKPRGVSTLTQQLARGFFLTPKKTYVRKMKELFIARSLERRMTKDEILTAYCNEAYLGRSAGFNIAGFGEASFVYFGKPVEDLIVEEAALLTGMLQAPSSLDPRRNPERAKKRRDLVLRMMAMHGFISVAEAKDAAERPIRLSPQDPDAESAPYFVDLVKDEAAEILGRSKLYRSGWEIETTLDPQLQAAAMDALRLGMEEVDERLAKKNVVAADGSRAQAALVALNWKTGAILALAGGRDYERTQLNRALAMRQPGSTFKPFVYAAAIQTGLMPDEERVLTPVSLLDNNKTVFEFGDEEYEPNNYGGKAEGFVTLREALVRSLNIPTVRLAEQVGYREVARLARKAGLENVGPTPAAALGSYEATLLNLAASYTVFANDGKRIEPSFIESIRTASGDRVVYQRTEQAGQRVLDKRVAHIVRDMMKDVVDRGTGAGIRRRGFRAPAAGKTGTDDDGWFVGFSGDVLCAVWVGFDDNTELKLEGGESALPIWAEFMNRTVKIAPYHRTPRFESPNGVVERRVNLAELYPFIPEIEGSLNEVFLEGSEPTTMTPMPAFPQFAALAP